MNLLRQADAVIVLGAAVRPDGSPSPALMRRVEHGSALVLAGAAPWLVMSGGLVRHPPAEAHLMRRMALSLGVPDNCVLIEDGSRNTFENARNCADIIQHRQWRQVLLVTDRMHMPRALFCFHNFGVNAAGSSAPVARGWRLALAREIPAFVVTVWRMARHRKARLER